MDYPRAFRSSTRGSQARGTRLRIHVLGYTCFSFQAADPLVRATDASVAGKATTGLPSERLISIQCNLSRVRNFTIAFFGNVFSQPYLMKFVLLDYTHFKRKRSHKIECSLNCTEWKSALSSSTADDLIPKVT